MTQKNLRVNTLNETFYTLVALQITSTTIYFLFLTNLLQSNDHRVFEIQGIKVKLSNVA